MSIICLGHKWNNFTIAVVERETGLSKDTLRVWERRYGFPRPGRDAARDRVYGGVEVQQLRLLRRLLDRGHRPAKVVGLGFEQLTAMANNVLLADPTEAPQREPVLDLLKQPDPAAFRDHLARQLATQGLVGFVCDDLAPLTAKVGEAWARGEIGVAQEHLFTEIATRLLRSHLQHLGAQQRQGKRILFATLPGEQHGLGLLMAECILSVKGHSVITLGTEVPMEQMLWASETYRCDALALSFSQARSNAFVANGVSAIRAVVPSSITIWIGGRGASLLKSVPDGVMVFRDLAELKDMP